ncbi:hypothetical protein [Streptomyces caniferus]|uniref:hypothetical protein n=1 Tax=Streptomyces caniferus TaxID=285557 RepID=UPI0038301CA7
MTDIFSALDERQCGPECAEMHSCTGRCVLAPLYPSLSGDEALLAALDSVRAWRYQQPHTDARRFAELDAILDGAAVGRIERQLGQDAPTSLPDAVEAHHRLMKARRRALNDARRIWDQAEADAIRSIARFMPRNARQPGEGDQRHTRR